MRYTVVLLLFVLSEVIANLYNVDQTLSVEDQCDSLNSLKNAKKKCRLYGKRKNESLKKFKKRGVVCQWKKAITSCKIKGFKVPSSEDCTKNKFQKLCKKNDNCEWTKSKKKKGKKRGECKPKPTLPLGKKCDANDQCASGICLGRCCDNRKGSDLTNCAACNLQGACKACNTGYSFDDSSNCIKDGSLGPGDFCTTNISCASGTCAENSCCTTYNPNCESCTDTGPCDFCFEGFPYDEATGLCLVDEGGDCKIGSECASGSCSGDRCDATKTPGEQCMKNINCTTDACIGGYCCTNNDPNCTSCDGSGACDACSDGHYLDDNKVCQDLLSGGDSCSSDAQCSNGTCAGGVCCAVSNVGCTDCSGFDGNCKSCDTGYYLAIGVCSVQKSAGDSCVFSNECSSGLCLEGFCCSANDSNCASCNSSGACDICSDGHYADDTNKCQPLLIPGSNCSSSTQCASLTCAGGNCCSVLNLGCAKCSEKGGVCTSCHDHYYADDNKVCQDHLSGGDSCSSDDQCSNGTCAGGVCCAVSNVGCTDCGGFDGNCNSCAAGYYLAIGVCSVQKSAGDVCVFSNECSSGLCLEGFCCSSNDSNCASCDSSGSCNECNAGGFLDESTKQCLILDYVPMTDDYSYIMNMLDAGKMHYVFANRNVIWADSFTACEETGGILAWVTSHSQWSKFKAVANRSAADHHYNVNVYYANGRWRYPGGAEYSNSSQGGYFPPKTTEIDGGTTTDPNRVPIYIPWYRADYWWFMPDDGDPARTIARMRRQTICINWANNCSSDSNCVTCKKGACAACADGYVVKDNVCV